MAKYDVVFDSVDGKLKYKKGTKYIPIGLKDILEGGNNAANKDIVDLQQVRCERVVAQTGITFVSTNGTWYLYKVGDDGNLIFDFAP